ncbi:PRA1 family protein F2 [Hibiscus syriacus]|uniref:PRA1 family protein n=1 Tax=Hibiscus syriacus TaxID=106335 RepID=A0A6A2XFC7_HIBSY|nr:PRA1 family protein F3-like [Hibiscus syriacus]KAE8674142.1 PRA1 family protein F2 [Hibiscus syriacus]
MTTYGTIPTSSTPLENLEYLSRAKDCIKEGLGARRPWKFMFNIHSINCPRSVSEAISRFRTNVAYFRMNYVMIVFIILLLGLLWHPTSLIILITMMALWLFLYFLRDKPLVVFNCTIGDSVLHVVLGVLTCVFLLLTDATGNILVSVFISVVVALVHASLRKIDDLYDEETTGFISGPSSSSS